MTNHADITQLHEALIKLSAEHLEKAGALSKGILAGLAAGGGALGLGGYALGKARERESGLRNRNLAFGAGLAAGTLAPQVVSRGAELLRGVQGALGPPPAAQPGVDYGQYY